MLGHQQNGWWFWLVDEASRRSLRDVWHEYIEHADVDSDDEIDDVADDEEEEQP